MVAGDLVDVRRADEESKLFQLRGLHLVNILGFSLTMSAKMEFLLKSMKGVDFARVMSQNMIFMMVGRILTAPFVTQLSSVVGRLKVYYMIMASYVLTDVLHAAMGEWPVGQCRHAHDRCAPDADGQAGGGSHGRSGPVWQA